MTPAPGLPPAPPTPPPLENRAGAAAFPEIRAQGVWLRLGSRFVLKDVCCALHGPGVHLVLGERRSGRSSLLALLSGRLLPTQGQCWLQGEPAHTLPAQAAAQMGWWDPELFQRQAVDVRMLRGGWAPAGMAKAAWDDAVFEQACTFLSLPRRGLAGHFTPSDRRRLAWAWLLARAPKVLFLDEPFAGLPPEDVHRFLALLEAWLDTHAATVVCSGLAPSVLAHKATHVHLLGRRQLWLSSPIDALPGRVMAWRWQDGPQASQWKLPATLGRLIRSHDGSPVRQAWVLDTPPDDSAALPEHLKAQGATHVMPITVSWEDAVSSLLSAGPARQAD